MNRFLRGRLTLLYRLGGWCVVDEINAQRIKYRPYTDIGQILFYGYKFEQAELELCSKYLTEESVILDIGANIGLHSINFSNIAPKGMVFAFEPSPDTFNLLLFNTIDKDNILPVNLGISDSNSINDFFVASDDAYSGFKDTKRKNIEKIRKVVSLKLDDIFCHLNLDKIDLVKIDVEGLEHNVLVGMQWLIERYKPVVFCEIYGGSNSNECPDETVNFVEDKGYEAFVLVEGVPEKYEKHSDRYYNYLFLPKSGA